MLHLRVYQFFLYFLSCIIVLTAWEEALLYSYNSCVDNMVKQIYLKKHFSVWRKDCENKWHNTQQFSFSAEN